MRRRNVTSHFRRRILVLCLVSAIVALFGGTCAVAQNPHSEEKQMAFKQNQANQQTEAGTVHLNRIAVGVHQRSSAVGP